MINPNWDDQRLLEEMSFAFNSKNFRSVSKGQTTIRLKGEDIQYVDEFLYKSKFTDGTIDQKMWIKPQTHTYMIIYHYFQYINPKTKRQCQKRNITA